MIDTKLFLYLASRERLARLSKIVKFAVLPRMHEYIKVRNRQMGDYFAFTVVQITHREDGPPELWMYLKSFVNGRSVIDFTVDSELDEYVRSYEQEGWELKSMVPNRTFRENGESVWPTQECDVNVT